MSVTSSGGYSPTPLYKKLGIKPGFRIMVTKQQKEYSHFFEEWPESVEWLETAEISSIDFIHLFVTSRQQLEKSFDKYLVFLKPDGMIWISWPKGSSSIHSTINRDEIRAFVLETTHLVDIKVASISSDWSGLKFVIRKAHR